MIDARIVRYVSTRSQKYIIFFCIVRCGFFWSGSEIQMAGMMRWLLEFPRAWIWVMSDILIYPMVIPFYRDIPKISNGYPIYPMVIQWLSNGCPMGKKKDRMDDAFPTISRCPRYLIFTRHLWLGVAHQYPVWQSPRILLDIFCWFEMLKFHLIGNLLYFVYIYIYPRYLKFQDHTQISRISSLKYSKRPTQTWLGKFPI